MSPQPQLTQNLPWCPRHAADELSGPKMTLTCEESGLLDRLRDYSWVNGGIPNDPDFLKRLAKVFQISAYKWKRLWPRIENFFTVRDGVLLHPEDEQERRGKLIVISKRKLAGQLGAQARWTPSEKSAPGPVPVDSKPDGKCHFENPADAITEVQPHSERVVSSTTCTVVEPSEAAAAGSLIPVSDTDRIDARARAVNLPTPSAQLALQIRERFREIPIDELVGLLVAWPGQESCGLWLHKSAAELDAERTRQLRKKPTKQDEQLERLMRRAAARDQAAGR